MRNRWHYPFLPLFALFVNTLCHAYLRWQPFPYTRNFVQFFPPCRRGMVCSLPWNLQPLKKPFWRWLWAWIPLPLDKNQFPIKCFNFHLSSYKYLHICVCLFMYDIWDALATAIGPHAFHCPFNRGNAAHTFVVFFLFPRHCLYPCLLKIGPFV